jgi:manganese efflux pump family protein
VESPLSSRLIAVAVLAVLGGRMLFHEAEGEGETVAELATRDVFAAVAHGISISVDELAVGLTIGLLRLSLWRAINLIGLQAFLFSQLGLRLGRRLNERFRERAEQLAGFALLGVAVMLIVEQVS